MYYEVKKTAEILKMLRKETNGLTQEKIAEEMGINIKTYQAAEQGVRGVSIDTLCIIADYYKVTLDYLITGKQASNSAWNQLFENVPEDKKEQLYSVVAGMISMIE